MLFKRTIITAQKKKSVAKTESDFNINNNCEQIMRENKANEISLFENNLGKWDVVGKNSV